MTTGIPALDALNVAPVDEACARLDGLYEHSPWIVRAALARRPFATPAALIAACADVVDRADVQAQLALIRAHPELAGKAMVAGTLTAESTDEQSRAGLTHCTPEEYASLQRLNAEYRARFGWPFILAVRGPRGRGLSRAQIIAAFERRLHAHPDDERRECLRQIHRIAEIRLHDKLGWEPTAGHAVWDQLAALARHSEHPKHLTVTYLSAAHRACAADIVAWMRAAGCDTVDTDAVGNVVGRYAGQRPDAPWLLTGSHYDTVRHAGPHDGRLGIAVPLAAVHALHARGERLPFGIEVVAFAEEEGQRYPATFLGSAPLVGAFDPAWLDLTDADGIPMAEAMRRAGLPGTQAAIAACARDPARYLGFVEVHIEQGPVLSEANRPLGIVTGINGSVRWLGEYTGVACHAGTTPMTQRRDAAAGAAELTLAVERLARQHPGTVGTVGILEVPAGSINVVPGRCRFSLDLRAPTDAARDALARAVLEAAHAIAAQRGLALTLRETLRASAAPSHPDWQARWERAVAALGLPLHHLPSGAGHDAMMLHRRLPQAMLFVRGENGGISHNPLESTTSDDIELAVQAFARLLRDLAAELA
ncbi:2-oxo-4-hydroxy-4-carboxy-5-ureidoimidazoline decarboxylase [Tepidimonas sp.]|uniref:2-oxo-4-hydroxy-4-carboxy-5-ureidoimidazoline decarboxylase n=1 Tax=Tepidimonas sp. TaxID=2002775 RepID=UPI00391A44EF